MFATNSRECPTCGEFVEGLENCWRPASEKPEKGQQALIYHGTYCEVADFNGVMFGCASYELHPTEILAWMPIPDGWQEYVKDN